MYKVFIDGSAGTTGLRIYDRLKERKDITLLTLPEELRKDYNARQDKLNSADVVFLCLPDDAAKEAVKMIQNEKVKVIDTSTAHRTLPNWAYGFSELTGKKQQIQTNNKIANPGCHASGVISLIAPLVENGIISNDLKFSCFSLTGYTGGGKKMIAEYESDTTPLSYLAPRQYGLTQSHKHLPEIVNVCNLKYQPCFCPIVSNYACGMQVTIPLFISDIKGNINDIKNCYKQYYNGKVVKYIDNAQNGFLSANLYSGNDGMAVSVYGNEDRILLVSLFDNLGKGASGAAIQNMNICLGQDETMGLIL